MSYVAWLDESGSNQTVDPGTYILSAAISEALHAEAMREIPSDLDRPLSPRNAKPQALSSGRR